MFLKIRVLPKSSKNEIIGEMKNGDLKIKLTTPPIDGKANEALIKLLSKEYKVAKSSIKIIKGEKSKNKVVEIL